MIIDPDQLLTQTQVAKLKRMTLQLLAHHLEKKDAPRAVLVAGRKLYQKSDVRAWRPKRAKGGPVNNAD